MSGDIIKRRRDTAANWTSNDTVLEDGQIGYETDTRRMKVGDGVTAWTGLGYIVSTAGSVEGTDVLSTGETGGTKFLREDGDGTCSWQEVSAGAGTVDTSGTPQANDIARFTDADTIEGRSYAELRNDINVEDGADVTDEANVVAALSGATLSDIGTPASSDKIILQDASDSDNLKYADFSEFSGGGAPEGTAILSTGETGGVKYLREDGDGTCSWQTPSGAGDVTGPGSATDNAIVRMDGTTGKLIQNSNVTIDDSGNITGQAGAAGITSSGAITLSSNSNDLVLATNGALTVPSTVDGRDLATDGSKLDGIESGATADQTDSEIKTAVDNELTGSVVGTTDTQTLTNKTITMGGTFDGNAQDLYGYHNEYNAQTGTTYTFVAGDRGKVVTFNNASAITATVPDTLSEGWTVTIAQLGAGQVTVATSGSMNLRNRQTHTKLAGQYAMGTLAVYTTNNVLFGGDTAT